MQRPHTPHRLSTDIFMNQMKCFFMESHFIFMMIGSCIAVVNNPYFLEVQARVRHSGEKAASPPPSHRGREMVGKTNIGDAFLLCTSH
jgi:hypothetical protein